jgi:hypothetical protein
MSGRSVRARRFTSAAAIVAVVSLSTFAVTSTVIGATTPPTTTVAGTSAPTTAAPTAPATTVPSPAAPTTLPGPTPRASSRVASPIDIEKIRATSLPFRTMGIAIGGTILLLAVAGFIYGKLRSRIPAVKVPKLAAAGSAPTAAPTQASASSSGAPLPPPTPFQLPPPAVEDAVSDTVIFEPPPTHHAPEVIAEPAREADDAVEQADVVDGDSDGPGTRSPDDPGPDTPDRD